MYPGAGPALPSNRPPMMMPAMVPPAIASEMSVKDSVINWYRGEFAAANAIIDVLCNHITQLSSYSGGGAAEYEAAFAAIHRRRLNWIPMLQMQKYLSITDVALELQKVAADKKPEMKPEVVKGEDQETTKNEIIEVLQEKEDVNNGGNGCFIDSLDDDSPKSEITDTGSQELQVILEHPEICDDHQDCRSRFERIKMTKGFVAKESVKGHMVNFVKDLKMYEDIFTDGELSKLNDFVDELRVAGQNGQLLGETYVLFNKDVKGSKRERVQLGAPIFGPVRGETANETQKTNIEPIPALLQSVIDHLVQWHIIPESRRPNGCIINYFNEGEYSQPYLKPPHLDQPICCMLLSDSTLAFGRTLLHDSEGNFKGHLMLPIKQGSVLVMRNNSASIARHALCSSPSKRVSITFYRVRSITDHNHFLSHSTTFAPMTRAMSLWQPGNPNPYTMIPTMVPMLTLSGGPIMMSPARVSHEGTGVYFPWGARPRKPAKQLPPRALDNMLDPGSQSKAM